jgi:hypothetical protein
MASLLRLESAAAETSERFDVCYTAAHGNKETLKISHFDSQETSGDGFIAHKEGGFTTHQENGGHEGAQIGGEI